jgi:hypothetical protein
MSFIPIKLWDYVRKHLKSNPGENEREVTAHLRRALADYKAGARCDCGEAIWVIGSAVVGNACFTCITGEADPSDDYEIAEACYKPWSKHAAPYALPEPDSSLDSVFTDSEIEDRDVPF